MGIPLRVLIVEDSEDEALLLVGELKRGGYDPTFKRVDTPSTMRDALNRERWDIVIADYVMPQFSGLDALKMLKERGLDLPFIIVSDKISEETAVEVMKAGASDYIFKENLTRLIPAVKLDLDEAEMGRERKRTDEEILSATFDSIDEGVTTLSVDFEILNTNATLLKMLGRAIEEVIGKKCYQVFHSEGSPHDECPLEKAKISRQKESAEIFEPNLNVWFSESVVPIFNEEGQVIRVVQLVRDITERKRIEQMKTDFVSMVSHQLLTPMVLIGGYIDILLEGLRGDLAAKQRECLYDMKEACSKNMRLVSDLLNVSRIERGMIQVEIKPLKLKEIVDLAVKDYRELAKKKGLSLNLDKIEDEIIVLADKDKMVEALANVINNAVKFTEKGSITIKTKRREGFALVEVADTGKGISQDLLGKLFNKDQMFSSTPSEGKGSGLGLYIAKSFVLLQNGDISVTSEVGKGSSFVFKIPLARV